jgi:hypothetical protein
VAGENVEIVRRFIGRFIAQDIDGALADVDAAASLDWSNSGAPDSGTYAGRAGWLAFARARDEVLAGRGFEIDELLEVKPDTVLLAGRMGEHGRASGIDVEAQGAAVFTLSRGKIRSIKLYQTSAPRRWRLSVSLVRGRRAVPPGSVRLARGGRPRRWDTVQPRTIAESASSNKAAHL